jgi:hypothetical protein
VKAAIAIIENDPGQVLVLQEPDGTPTLPRFTCEETQSLLKVMRRSVPEQLGIEIAGWAEVGVLTEGKHQLWGFRAYVSGGKLRHLPTKEYLSASWVSPHLAALILNGQATQFFLKQRYPNL